MAEEKLHTDQENHQTEFYYNSPSGKHYIDMDLPPHWFRYFTEENEQYFFNELTGETTWDKPEIPASETTQPETTTTHIEAESEVNEENIHQKIEELHTEPDYQADEVNQPQNIEEEEEARYSAHETKTEEAVQSKQPYNPFDEHDEVVVPEEPFDKSQLVTYVQNNGPRPAPRTAEPVAVAVDAVDTPVIAALSVEPDPLPTHTDHIAGSSSPFFEDVPKSSTSPTASTAASQPQAKSYYTTSRGILTEERIRNWDPSKPAAPSSNPFGDDDETPAPSSNPFNQSHVKPSPAPLSKPSTTATTATYTYSPPPPPVRAGGEVKKQSHNPFMDNSPDTRYHQPHHNVPPPQHTRQSALVQAAMANNGVNRPNPPPRQPSQQPAPIPVTVTPPSQPQPPPAKQPSSLLLALKAEKAQQQQQMIQKQSSTSNPFDEPDVPSVVPSVKPAAAPLPPSRGDKRRSNPLVPTGAVHAAETVAFNNANQGLTPQLIKLLQFGVKQNPAMNALYNSQNNPKIALSTLHQQIAASLTVDVHATQVHVFKPRISTRIKSWLPNFLDSRNADYHTRYVCNISYDMINSTIQSWQVDFRYSNIKDLYFIVQKYASEINSICPMIETFPLSTVSQGLFGIDDKVRNERMNKFDLWLRELIMNPLAMTIWEIVEATYLFLEFNKHIYET